MTARQPVTQGGIFGAANPRPMSSQTKELLKVMMEEAKLTNFQRRKLNDTADRGKALPLKVPPTCSEKQRAVQINLPPRKVFNMIGTPPSSLRTREEIEESGAYERPQFVPKPIRSLDVEKERLSNYMAYGEDVKPKSREQILKERRAQLEKEQQQPPIDRFEEIQAEIEERKKFLDNMEKVGKGKEYRPIISAQISGLIREMEVIDKKRSEELANALLEEEETRR